MSQSGTQNTEFNFAAQPQVVKAKKKYRTEQFDSSQAQPDNYTYQNLMFEKRVVRGNTYSQYMVATSEVEEAPLQVSRMRRNPIKRNTNNSTDDNRDHESADYNFRGMVLQPPPDCNFAESYTCDNVEIETDLPPCHDATTQTEWIIEKKIPDLSMPVYTGVEKETQIYPSDNLFDFDYESEPVVQVLVSRCLEESRIEVCEEEELHTLQERQKLIISKNEQQHREWRDLQQKEQEKHQLHETYMARKRRQRQDMIDVHQHMVSRVYSKRFVEDVSSAAFEILDNMCMFMDEREKDIKVNFMPWLVEEALNYSKKDKGYTKVIDGILTNVDQECVNIHKKIVHDENEVRRIQREEEERIAREKAEAKAAKLAWKIQRRVDRRLYHLQNEIIEKFVNKADHDQDIVNISDFDGSDADGLKTVGFRGGVIGEFCRVILQLKKEGRFSEFDFDDEEEVQDLFNSVYREFISDGWTFTVGLSQEFEQNLAYALGEFQMSELTMNFVKGQEDDEHSVIENYILKHYYSSYDFNFMPELKQLQEMQLKLLRPPTEKAKDGGDEIDDAQKGSGNKDGDDGDQGDEDEDDSPDDAKNPNEMGQQEVEVDHEKMILDFIDTLPQDVKEYRFILNAVLSKILSKDSSINNVKFNLAQIFSGPKQGEDDEKSKTKEEDDAKPANNTPLAFCVFLPEPLPEENDEEVPEPTQEPEVNPDEEVLDEQEEVSLLMVQ